MMSSHYSTTPSPDHTPTEADHLSNRSALINHRRSIRLPVVLERTGLKKTTIYALQKKGTFPHSIPLTGNAVGWLESEVEAWLARRAATRSRPTGER